MKYKDYYQILGVDKSATGKDIKRSYRKLAQQYHPDKNPGNPAAEAKFKEINEAYQVLGNEDNRATYDQLGANYHHYKQRGGNPNDFDFSQWANQGTQQNINFEDLFGGAGGRAGGTNGFSDFFESIFRGSAGAQGQTHYRQPPRNIEQIVEISLEEAFHGTSRTYERPGGERFVAKIPRGAADGAKIRLRGKGSVGAQGAGDLLLQVQVASHSIYTREKNDLHRDFSIPVLTAVLGGTVVVPTLHGDVKLKIPAGTQGGRRFRLKGYGMPVMRQQDQYGDLFVKVRITVPKTLSDKERDLYQQLALHSASQSNG